MSEQYIISIDQSTQGTKALLFDESGSLIRRTDKSHEQIVNEKGWVSHDPAEIYHNTIEVVRRLVEESGIEKDKIAGLGISNQRETSLAWIRRLGSRSVRRSYGSAPARQISASGWKARGRRS